MFCPKCGDTLKDVNGELTCVRGDMGLSRDMARRLSERYGTCTRPPPDSSVALPRRGGWYCPGCGVRAEESEGVVRCPRCKLPMNEFLFQLTELHPHR